MKQGEGGVQWEKGVKSTGSTRVAFSSHAMADVRSPRRRPDEDISSSTIDSA